MLDHDHSRARSVRGEVMDRVSLQKYLAQAERHVMEVEGHLARQRLLIHKLEQHQGRGARAARLFLRSLEAMQALHVADRDRVRAQLGMTRPPQRPTQAARQSAR
jgi:hypothetical protein